MPSAIISGLSYHLPENTLTNKDLSNQFQKWSENDIEQKTGIKRRHIAKEGQCASDLAINAAEGLLTDTSIRSSIDYLLLCTQSPDHILPSSSCIIQSRLGLSTNCGALDFNLGCSGYIYGLGLAQGLIASGQASRVLLLTADTYSRYIDESDRGLRVLFGDAAAATLIDAAPESRACWPFHYGTDGTGSKNLIVTTGGSRSPHVEKGKPRLYMNGPEIFTFTLKVIPEMIRSFLSKINMALEDIDLFVFHQANQFMLEHLRQHLAIPSNKFIMNMQNCGNTVSSSIPIALVNAEADGLLRTGQKILLVGFGVGYSWGATLLTWPSQCTFRKSTG